MNAKVLKSEQDYEGALKAVSRLIDLCPEAGSEKFEELELLSLLIKDYERSKIDLALPDPIAAINFRMSQQGLTRKDLEPFIGGKGKVSEILNKKKSLSLQMIRKLNSGLRIPLEVLVQEYELATESQLTINNQLLKALIENQFLDWFDGTLDELKSNYKQVLSPFFKVLEEDLKQPVTLLRSSVNAVNTRSLKEMDMMALHLWQAKAFQVAKAKKTLGNFDKTRIDKAFLTGISKLSRFDNGPLLAQEELSRYGIHLLVIPHLPKTYLDGAVIPGPDGNPIIAMSLRYDRIDNFWFVLLHELSHVCLHYDNQEVFIDDLDSENASTIEQEADELALESLIPNKEWKKYKAFLRTADSVLDVANELSIHPAIVAGRYRKDKNDYRAFSRLIGSKGVRKLFD